MDVNISLGFNSGSSRRADRSGSQVRRRSSQHSVEPEFEPKIEWVDTPEAHVLVADLPGFKKDDVKVQLDVWGNLIISGERQIEELVYAGGVWHPRKRTGFKFKKVFSIPEDANTTNVTARFENEMFYIIINKLRPPQEIRSTNILDQESKSIPQDGESDAKFIEESKEIKDGKVLSNKPNQILRDEKVETPKVAKSSATRDDKASSNRIDQSPINEKVKNPEVGKSRITQDDKSLSNKMDQGPRGEKVGILGVKNSSTTQCDKSSCNKIDQSPREEKVETPEVANSTVAQDDKASSNKPIQSTRDKKVELSKVTKSSATQLDDENHETPKVKKSTITQDAIPMETQLEASNKLEDLAKQPPLSNKEKLVDSNSLTNQSELLDSYPKEVEVKVGDQHEHELVENVIVKSNPHHEDHTQEIEASSIKEKKEDDSSDYSHIKEDKGAKEKQSNLKVFPYVSQFISSRSELMFIASIIIFSLALYIICILTHLED